MVEDIAVFSGLVSVRFTLTDAASGFATEASIVVIIGVIVGGR